MFKQITYPSHMYLHVITKLHVSTLQYYLRPAI